MADTDQYPYERVTEGWVTQQFDAQGNCTSQRFHPGDASEEYYDPSLPLGVDNLIHAPTELMYKSGYSMDMVQPEKEGK